MDFSALAINFVMQNISNNHTRSSQQHNTTYCDHCITIVYISHALNVTTLVEYALLGDTRSVYAVNSLQWILGCTVNEAKLTVLSN